jgi:hypothetical protein
MQIERMNKQVILKNQPSKDAIKFQSGDENFK